MTLAFRHRQDSEQLSISLPQSAQELGHGQQVFVFVGWWIPINGGTELAPHELEKSRPPHVNPCPSGSRDPRQTYRPS
jgi:hypothetical protein